MADDQVEVDEASQRNCDRQTNWNDKSLAIVEYIEGRRHSQPCMPKFVLKTCAHNVMIASSVKHRIPWQISQILDIMDTDYYRWAFTLPPLPFHNCTFCKISNNDWESEEKKHFSLRHFEER